VACAACCAGPVLAFLAAIGLGTVLGLAIFGLAGSAVAALVVPVVLRLRRQRAASCTADSVPVTLGPTSQEE
jgi:hypothetical protein